MQVITFEYRDGTKKTVEVQTRAERHQAIENEPHSENLKSVTWEEKPDDVKQ
jgi:hypothetical protein